MKPLDIIIPVYNEKREIVEETIAQLAEAFCEYPEVSIIVVNDGSDEKYGVQDLAGHPDITYVAHNGNQGYGRALKTGILSGTAPWIAITDADGTYPIQDLPVLYEKMNGHDMVIGTRTGSIREIPWLRRFPKAMLNLLASYMAGVKISDLNSGMRIFSRELSYYLWDFFPRGFSFTSTITMGSIMGGFRILEHPINYYKREGQSSIHPIKDTIRFFRLVCRLGLVFHPIRIFTPVAVVLFILGMIKGFAIDYPKDGYIGNLATMSILSAIQIFMMGLIGKLIVHGRFFRYQRPLEQITGADEGIVAKKTEEISVKKKKSTDKKSIFTPPANTKQRILTHS